MDKHNLNDWVDERIAKLAPASAWHPDAERALARLNQHRAAKSNRGVWMLGAAAGAAACACLLAFPTSRDFVRNLWPSASPHEMAYVGQVSADLKTLKYRQPPPAFVLKDSSGSDVRLSDYKGRVVLLNFWATTCGGCRTEVPWLIGFEQQYKSRGFEVIGISLDNSWKVMDPFLREEQVNYKIVLGDDDTTGRYGLTAMPMTLLIDRAGNLSGASVGLINKDECQREILRLLDTPSR
jgi:cytochrome c biogenesis protein CcmG/thiol:disulfide interchange protein DsbE